MMVVQNVSLLAVMLGLGTRKAHMLGLGTYKYTPILVEKADVTHDPPVQNTQASNSADQGTTIASKSMGKVTGSPKYK